MIARIAGAVASRVAGALFDALGRWDERVVRLMDEEE